MESKRGLRYSNMGFLDFRVTTRVFLRRSLLEEPAVARFTGVAQSRGQFERGRGTTGSGVAVWRLVDAKDRDVDGGIFGACGRAGSAAATQISGSTKCGELGYIEKSFAGLFLGV